jgi:hypothetical protein
MEICNNGFQFFAKLAILRDSRPRMIPASGPPMRNGGIGRAEGGMKGRAVLRMVDDAPLPGLISSPIRRRVELGTNAPAAWKSLALVDLGQRQLLLRIACVGTLGAARHHEGHAGLPRNAQINQPFAYLGICRAS